MKRKIPRTRLIITALIFGLAAILTTLAQRNAEATPPQASTEFDAIDDYVRWFNSMIFECRAPHWASSRMERSSTSRRSATLTRTGRDGANPIQDRVVEQIVHSPGGLAASSRQAGSSLTHPQQYLLPEFRVADPEHRSASPSGTY